VSIPECALAFGVDEGLLLEKEVFANAVAHRNGGRIELTIMDGKNWTGKWPELRYNTGHAQTIYSPVQSPSSARNPERGENPQSVGG
jgi:hypothetical protein